jgi:hypothetical protein
MTGAIEFLRKAKAIICEYRQNNGMDCIDAEVGSGCPAYWLCNGNIGGHEEAELVRKVMDYQIKEASDETKKA